MSTIYRSTVTAGNAPDHKSKFKTMKLPLPLCYQGRKVAALGLSGLQTETGYASKAL